MTSSLKHGLLLGLLALTAACASTPDEMELLDKSFTLYEHSLRWQNYDVLIGFHKEEQDKLTEEKRRYLRQFRVTAYNVVYSQIGEDRRSATQIVEIKYYNDAYAVVRDLTLNQDWKFDDKARRWELHNPFPEFK